MISCGLPSDLEGLEVACREGDGVACRGALELLDRAEPVDWARVVAFAERGCELEDGYSCFKVGWTKQRGLAREVDLDGALAAYRLACDHDRMAGCHNAAVLALAGHGGEQDRAAAPQLLGRACDRGELRACTALGGLYLDGEAVDRDVARARAIYERACTADEGPSCVNLAALHLYGDLGEGADPARAFPLYERSCELGTSVGCRMMGELLESGRGTSADPPRARELFARACDQDEARACLLLALARHRDAPAATEERAAVLALFERSCSLRDHDGCRNAGVYYRDGLAGAPDPARAQERLGQACELGSAPSCAAVGR